MNKNNLKRIAVFMSVMSIIKTQLKANAQKANNLLERQLAIEYGGPNFFKSIEDKKNLERQLAIEYGGPNFFKSIDEKNKKNKENEENLNINNSSENVAVINNSSGNKNTKSMVVENNFQDGNNSIGSIIKIEQK